MMRSFTEPVEIIDEEQKMTANEEIICSSFWYAFIINVNHFMRFV